jgi:hypothetical protein
LWPLVRDTDLEDRIAVEIEIDESKYLPRYAGSCSGNAPVPKAVSPSD